jgi:hypothetical protein
MKNNQNQQQLNQQLTQLWSQRAHLIEPEWTQLYQLVYQCLRGKHWSLLETLPGENDDYIHDFFTDKVFLTVNNGTELHHSGALVKFYERYLLDRKRALPVKLAAESDLDGDDDVEDVEKKVLDRNSALEFEYSDAAEELKSIADLIELMLTSAPGQPDLIEMFRTRFNLDVAQIATAATQFLSASSGWEVLQKELSWIHLYLTAHFCADEETRISLVELSRRYHIPSYYQRAIKLGINIPKQNDAALRSFQASYRGQWLAQLGIPVDTAHRTELFIALKILCLVALSQ